LIFGVFVSTVPFYYFTVEHYYVGKLVLPEINAIDDGSLVYVGMCLVLAYYGLGVMRASYDIPFIGPITPV